MAGPALPIYAGCSNVGYSHSIQNTLGMLSHNIAPCIKLRNGWQLNSLANLGRNRLLASLQKHYTFKAYLTSL